MKNQKRETAKTKLAKAIDLLISAKLIIEEENKNGKQFDFCTDTRLSSLSDHITSLAKYIDNIVYQGRKIRN